MDEYVIWDFTVPGISFNVNSGRITIFKATLVALGYPEYFRFRFDPEQRVFGIEPCDMKDGGSYRLPKVFNREHYELKCKDLVRFVYAITDKHQSSWAAGSVNMKTARNLWRVTCCRLGRMIFLFWDKHSRLFPLHRPATGQVCSAVSPRQQISSCVAAWCREKTHFSIFHFFIGFYCFY